MGVVYLLLSVSCSLIIAHLLKATEDKGLRTLNVLTFNYLVAFVIAFLYRLESPLVWISRMTPVVWLVAVVVGSMFIANFVVYSKSAHRNGVGVSVAAMRLSLLIPVLLSILMYKEVLSAGQSAGILMVFGALFLLMPRKQKLADTDIQRAWMLWFLFICTGLTDGSLKIYEEDFSAQLSEGAFMGLVFLTAFIIGAVLCWKREGRWITRREAIMGTAIGVPNLFTSIFLIYTLQYLEGAVTYTAVNLLTVLGGTILGKVRWKDQVSRLQWIGIATAIVAITLLI